MNRDLLKGFLQIGFFVGAGGFLMAVFQPRDSPEFVISLCSGAIGTALIAGVVLLVRISR